ncbi:glycosyltransferase family 2 protein [Bosea sp. (in: a-proteobacteria)]|uniref:glycosyltransferase family 2 protein n=1 Tax=Bosea sp. (in: a-proteobacteria) TaxID=1871050 RepID=UPI003F700307
MTGRLRLSVVIPTYRRQRELGHALASLAPEAELIDEVVVVDDGSPEPVEIAPPPVLKKRVRLVRLPQNVGASGARQAAVDHATGDLIAFLDSDDAWLPGKLAAQLPFFSSGDAMLAVATGWQDYHPGSRNLACRMPVGATEPRDFASGCWFCPGSTVVIGREAWNRVGPLDAGLRRLEDLDWFLRFGLAGGKLVVADVIGAAIRHGAKNNQPLVDAAARRISERFATDARVTTPVLRNLRAYLDMERAASAYRGGNPAQATALMLRSLLGKPRAGLHLRQWWRRGQPRLSHAELEELLGISET